METEVLRAIHERRSTRKFTAERLTDQQLNAILDAAIWAPSGGNNQSWLFTAIQKPDTLASLNARVREAFARYTPDDDYPGKHGAKEYAKRDDFNCYHHAPTLVIASNKPNYENAMADCAMALQNMFLAATALGLGSCYVNQLHWLRDDAPLREFLYELGVPRAHTICAAAAFGHIAQAAPAPAPARKEGTIHIIR